MNVNGMNVNNIGAVGKIVANPVRRTVGPAQAGAGRGSDSVELSNAAGGNGAGKIASIRQAIAAGTYETDHKLDVAVDRMLGDLESA